MSYQNNGGPAFPCGLQSGHLEPMHEGLSLRDYFAAKALQGLLANAAYEPGRKAFGFTLDAYLFADQMLQARTK